MQPILLVGNEEKTKDLVKRGLKQDGYQVECVGDAQKAIRLLSQREYALILLDTVSMGLPELLITENCRHNKLPLLFLSDKNGVYLVAKGIQMGATDYLMAPFCIEELLMRVHIALHHDESDTTLLQVGGVLLDATRRRVEKDGIPIFLTPKEYDLLVFLMHHPNDVLYRERMFQKVWNENYMGNSRTLDLHIQRLRKKLGWEKRIKTIYRVGYQLNVS